jgi:3alpha(or 20beta)-hydroxysteroid dehydrogenase
LPCQISGLVADKVINFLGTVNTALVHGLEKATGAKMPTSQQCLDRLAEPEEVAKVIVFLLSDEASFITGSEYQVNGGWTA